MCVFFMVTNISLHRFVLFSGWEVVLKTCLDMRGLVYYPVNIGWVVVHVVLVTGMPTQMMTAVLGPAYQELLC